MRGVIRKQTLQVQHEGLPVEGTMVLWMCKPLFIRLLAQHSSESSQSYVKQVSC